MVNLKDVAAACGVSPATVSRALNAVGEVGEKGEMIREMALRMGYRPNAAARALKTNRSDNIGILYEDMMQHPYFSALIEGIRRRAEDHGYDLTFLSRKFTDGPDVYLSQVDRRGLDGVVVVQANFNSARIRALATSELPMVTIDYRMENCSSVLSDNAVGTASLVHHVNAMGHKRVAIFLGEEGSVTQERLQGFYKGCAECGIVARPEYMHRAHYRSAESCMPALEEMLSLPEKPTCILFTDDYACIGAINALHARGIRVPEDISVVGYDDILLGGMTDFRLTTWHQDVEGIGAAAIDMVVEAIAHEGSPIIMNRTISGHLEKGNTVLRLT